MEHGKRLDDISTAGPVHTADIDQISVFSEQLSHCFYVMMIPSVLKSKDRGSDGGFIRVVAGDSIQVYGRE